jgi:thimet oligopeptidase
VEPYEVFENGRLIGRIYLDMHPRADKGGSGASSATARTGVAGVQIPEMVLICRFPGGQANDPGLMTHDQVVTFFHEFGHLLHTISSARQVWAGLVRVSERDFVEAPSQMLEEWASDAATLATFARHYQTGEPIPAALVGQMRRATELGRGYDVRQQMVFARLSLALHDRAPAGLDPVTLHREIAEEYLPTPWAEGTHFPASFTHIANPNYSAAYYTYMWSLVIAKDLFGRFDSRDLFAAAAAKRYRDTILSAGGSKPASQLVTDFLGRPFSFTSWETWLNSRN